MLLNDLGTALDAQGLFKEAEEAVVESLEIVKSSDGADGVQEHLAVIECNLAEVQTHLGIYRIAGKFGRELNLAVW